MALGTLRMYNMPGDTVENKREHAYPVPDVPYKFTRLDGPAHTHLIFTWVMPVWGCGYVFGARDARGGTAGTCTVGLQAGRCFHFASSTL